MLKIYLFCTKYHPRLGVGPQYYSKIDKSSISKIIRSPARVCYNANHERALVFNGI